MKREFFAGGNTGEGFYNLFDGIVPCWEKENKNYILKGGPGVGKNTMMREIAKAAQESGYDMELFYCAGDPDSLDAVHVPERGFTILDGTPPHVREPYMPGVTDSIINLGAYLEERELVKNRDTLQKLFQENSASYELAYLFLKAAAKLARVERKEGYQLQMKDVRKLFLSAITYQGQQDFSDEFIKETELIVVSEEDSVHFLTEFMKNFKEERTEVFFDSLLPERIQFIHLVESDLMIQIKKKAESGQVCELIQSAVDSLKRCKAVHDEIEEIYKSAMNFAGVNKEMKQLIKSGIL